MVILREEAIVFLFCWKRQPVVFLIKEAMVFLKGEAMVFLTEDGLLEKKFNGQLERRAMAVLIEEVTV
jgi:hypothetical protein